MFSLQCCAVSFIENLTADSLNMPPEEFDRYMSGEAIPHDPAHQPMCEGLQLLQENLKMLADIRERQEKLMGEALKLQQDMVDFKESFIKEIQAVKDRTPLVIKPRKTKVDLDEEVTQVDGLPSPILPQVVVAAAQDT